jgi:heme iron utilization protein
MHISTHHAVNLLHHSAVGTLATHAREPAGYPYPTVLPFACDVTHAPLILASALAEHTRNLEADPRAGWLVFAASGDDVLSGARLTLVGEFLACRPSALTVARYLRYQPDAERFLALGDFGFYRLKLERMRYIGGFGTMGWLMAADWAQLPVLSESLEAELVEQLGTGSSAGVAVLGVDCFGADLRVGQTRTRIALDVPIVEPESLLAALMALLKNYS